MGRGNACVFGDYEGLYYVNWSNFSNQYEDEHGETIIDYQLQHDEWENALTEFIISYKKRFKSFSECDKYVNRDERAVLENSLFYIIVEDSEWAMAIKLIQKEQDDYCRGNIQNLQAGLYKTFLEGIKQCLFEQFEEIGTYDGAWTSGRIKRVA